MAPWTFDPSMSVSEVRARLKGLIQSDPSLELTAEGDLWVSVKATRNLPTASIDQIDFVIYPSDHVIVFQSKQIEGSNTSDFGANRKRLEDLRQRSPFGLMGQDLESADTSTQREGTLGQLKAFWGLQSGTGFEDVILE
jgi:uncharacterized protein (DUF1499 family)